MILAKTTQFKKMIFVMNSKIRMVFLILLLLPLSQTVASEKAIITLKKNHNIKEAELNKILKSPIILSYKSVWTKKEKSMLKSLKMDYIAKSWIIEVNSYSDLLLLERKINQSGLPLVIDDYEMPIKTQSADFRSLQWGLNNLGQGQNLDLDPVQNFRVPGVVGEDIRQVKTNIKSNKTVLVAVLDTGVDKTHPNLKNIIYRNEKECAQLAQFNSCVETESDRELCEKRFMTVENKSLDPDGNGYPLDCSGWSILGSVNQAGILGRPDFADDQGHGTHVAGIIAAQFDNEFKGVSGVSANVKILPIQVIGKKPSEPIKPLSVGAQTSSIEEESLLPKKTLGDLIARGLLYAMKSKVQVINFSLGWPGSRDSELLKNLISEAIKQGIVVVAAAGNDSTKALLRPCAYEGVICVGSYGSDGAISHFSNYGSGVDIAAPGLNILSTYPMDTRPIRFRDTWGFEYLSGTSQASPFVAGVVADMISRGVPQNEIYPRLILGARTSKPSQGIIEGAPHLDGKKIKAEDLVYKKFLLSGNLDYQNSLNQKETPLILPIIKEKTAIDFDLKKSKILFPLKIKNFWKSVLWSDVDIKVEFRKPNQAVRPQIIGINGLPKQGIFNSSEVQNLMVEAQIVDSKASDSRIPSDLELEVRIFIKNNVHRAWLQEYELLVPVSLDLDIPGAQKFTIANFPKGRVDWNPIDEALDNQPTKKDYILTIQEKNKWSVSLLTQGMDGVYKNIGNEKIEVKGDLDRVRTQILTRIPFNGQTHYILGILEDQSDNEEEDLPSQTQFFIFNKDFKLVETFAHKGDKAPMPYQVYWMQVGQTKKPCWVGYGKKTDTKPSLIDQWENPDGVESPELRFYFLDQQNKLQSLEEYQDYKIIDILEPTLKQKMEGIVPVILAKNLGTESKPSYIYDFAKAEIKDGKISQLTDFKSATEQYKYRNLIETRVDKILNLDLSNDEFQGTYWFNENGKREQRVTYFYAQGNQYYDRILKPMNPLFDSALLVRASYLGQKRAGSFVLTNSEIQFHDFISGQIVSTSLERYTFYPDDFLTSIYLPITLKDSKNLSQKLPALFTTESSEVNRGVRIVVPVFASTKDENGNATNKEKLVELMTPAKLRFESRKNSGCRPLNTPVFLGEQGYAFDYFCGDQILRLPLKF